ncbi:MAG: hypothetical protein WC222_07295 [Parachlamydiales bacterium]
MSWITRIGLIFILAIVPMVGSLNAAQIQNTANSSAKTGEDVAWWRYWGGPRHGGYYYHGPYYHYRHYYYW